MSIFSFVKTILILSLISTFATANEPSLSLKEASYFDTDSDGYVDQIEIQFILSATAQTSTVDFDEVSALLQLPPERYFTVLSYNYNDNVTLLVDVLENTSYANTAVMEYDIISSMPGIMSNGLILAESSIAIQDKMAPIAVEAVVVDSLNESSEDYLHVEFSEELHTSFSDNSEYINLKKSTETIPMDLQYDSAEELKYRFLITNGSQITQGDSLNIKEGTIVDLMGNVQMNRENQFSPVEILTIEKAVAVSDQFSSVHDGFTTHYNQSTEAIEISPLWDNGEVKIYGLNGKIVFKQQIKEGMSRIDLSTTLSNSIYFLEFSIGNESFTRKIAVRN